MALITSWKRKPALWINSVLLFALLHSHAVLADLPIAFPLQSKRVLFLGDSITHSGGYVSWIETQCRLQGISPLPEFINVGLSSETCTGLTEPDHPFPRPDVHERLNRALAHIQPDVVIACYGMNDGIYHPFSKQRFKAYQNGINQLITKVQTSGAKLVLMTPPPFDAVAIGVSGGTLQPAGSKQYAYFAPYEHYDREVIARYAQWILEQKDRVSMVIDLHTPLSAHLTEQRMTNPTYTLAPDGVHPNPLGQRMIGETILLAWGLPSITEPGKPLFDRMHQRMSLLHDAWLSHIGHKRPGVTQGLPLEQALNKADEMLTAIRPLIDKLRQPSIQKRNSTSGIIHEIHYPSEAAKGKLRIGVDFYLWIPDHVKTLRGIIVHQHGCGVGASQGGRTAADDLHWQALARKWNCALLGSMYEPRKTINCRLWCDSRNGSNDRFLMALEHFAQATGHGELNSIPWCLWGHSGGGFWSSLVQSRHPERIVAIWFRSGTAYGAWSRGEIDPPPLSPTAYQIPMMGNPGLLEKNDSRFRGAWDGLKAMQADYLSHGAPFFEFAPDPKTGHQCGDSRYLAIPFFDFWLEHRLPNPDSAQPLLKPTHEARASWNVTMAGKMMEYIQTGDVADSTPPPPPIQVTARRNRDGHVIVTWDAHADVESGIRAFTVERNGNPIAQIPELPANRYGRPLFQGMTYHDTPSFPLPAMQYLDSSTTSGKIPCYSIRTINTAGLVSDRAHSR